jgi:hypothetical protein
MLWMDGDSLSKEVFNLLKEHNSACFVFCRMQQAHRYEKLPFAQVVTVPDKPNAAEVGILLHIAQKVQQHALKRVAIVSNDKIFVTAPEQLQKLFRISASWIAMTDLKKLEKFIISQKVAASAAA